MTTDIENNSQEDSSPKIILEVASIWLISNIGYYLFLPALGFGGGYNVDPIQITLYYLFWIGVTVFAFWDIFQHKVKLENIWLLSAVVLLGGALITLFLGYVFPHLPSLTWSQSWKPASELLYATPWYFLPKSIDIFLQQLLVLVMVRAFSSRKYSLLATSLWCAGLFGGAHLLLVFGGGVVYTAIFTLSALVASFVFPYLILRVKNGFIYSYFLHWFFYAFVIIIIRYI